MPEPFIDLRSDTVTRPTAPMREAMSRAEVGDDVFGEDPSVNGLQERLAELLGIRREMPLASGWALSDAPTGRLVDICGRVGADTYLSGAGGQDYLDLGQFDAAGIRVAFQDFAHPAYPQRFGPFEPFMSVVDLLFNCGEESLEIIRRGRVSEAG